MVSPMDSILVPSVCTWGIDERERIDGMNLKILDRMCRQDRLRDALLVATTSDWVGSLALWQVIAHLTFEWECSLDAARRGFERWMAKEMKGVSYFYSIEKNPGRPGYHVHALFFRPLEIHRKAAWASWFGRFGRARIEPVRSMEDVTGYCAKYVTKDVQDQGWWNVKLFTIPGTVTENGLQLAR
jgi:hypothetical protein